MKSLKSADTHAAKPRTRIAMKSAHIPPPRNSGASGIS